MESIYLVAVFKRKVLNRKGVEKATPGYIGGKPKSNL